MPEIYDLTGNNIEDTYQRIIQTPDGLTLYDGTGSLVNIATASYALTADSSSYALTASYALSGGTITTLRHDYSGSYDYIGVAVSGTLESDASWNITRLTINLDGTSLSQTATGAWTNRVSLIYT